MRVLLILTSRCDVWIVAGAAHAGTDDGAGGIAQAQAGGDTIMIVSVVVACVALSVAAVAVFMAIKATRRGNKGGGVVEAMTVSVEAAPATSKEDAMEGGAGAAPRLAWAQE